MLADIEELVEAIVDGHTLCEAWRPPLLHGHIVQREHWELSQ